LVERVVADFGIAAFVRFTGSVERDVTVFIGEMLAAVYAARCRLVMQLGAESLRGARTGFGTRRGGVDLLLKRRNLRGARPAMCRANAAEHYSARCANGAGQAPLSANLDDNLLGHAGLPNAGDPDFQRKSSIAVPSVSGQCGAEIYLSVSIGRCDTPHVGPPSAMV
jgi:hypothetical protein